jgi:DNA-directed RNA polymerase subunit E'
MFYKTEVKDHIRVTPELFDLPVEDAVAKKIREKFEGHVSQELGIVIDVINVKSVGEGAILPGDGSYFYDTDFELLVFKPELHEVVYGKIKDIADFGAFMTIGPIEAMVHVSQSMDDYVSFSKDKVLVGRETKRTLKVGDLCKARIVAISLKDPASPKINLTMRQPGLGKIEWIAEDFQKEEKKVEKKPAKKGKDKEKR